MVPNCPVTGKRKPEPVWLSSVSASIYVVSIHADSRIAAVGCDDVTRGPGGLGSLPRHVQVVCLFSWDWPVSDSVGGRDKMHGVIRPSTRKQHLSP